jgi:hypothetical protein
VRRSAPLLAHSFEPDFRGFIMTKRSDRAIETQKKKARRAIPRTKVSRIQGNTPAVRKRLKKQAGLTRAAKTAG